MFSDLDQGQRNRICERHPLLQGVCLHQRQHQNSKKFHKIFKNEKLKPEGGKRDACRGKCGRLQRLCPTSCGHHPQVVFLRLMMTIMMTIYCHHPQAVFLRLMMMSVMMTRGEICPCRHCWRQCKIFASGVNFSIFTHFLCFSPLKLLKLGEIDGVKFLA